MPDNTRKPIQIDPRLLCRPHARMEGIQFRDKMEVDVFAIEGILSGLRGPAHCASPPTWTRRRHGV